MDPKKKRLAKDRRHARVRKKIRGTAERPRLAVYRSNKHIHAQVIDDVQGHTLLAASSLEDGVTAGDDGKSGVAAQVGALVAERCKAAGIETVVFDRGASRYAGRVKALADAAREGGLEF